MKDSTNSVDDAGLSKSNVCRCNTRTLRFLGIKDAEQPTTRRITVLSFLLLFATRYDTTRHRNHSDVYSAVIRVGDCLSATLYKLCDFSCHIGSSPIRANTSRSLATSHIVSPISFLKIVIINFRTRHAYDRCMNNGVKDSETTPREQIFHI